MTIQWFPGHMAKARREVTEKLKLIDIVYELVDARIPMSSRNPMIEDILKNKPRIMLLNKADKADAAVTQQWKEHFENQGIRSLSINSVNGQGLNQIVPASKEILQEKFDRMRAKGVKPSNSRFDYRHSKRWEINAYQPAGKEKYSKNGRQTWYYDISAVGQSRERIRAIGYTGDFMA